MGRLIDADTEIIRVMEISDKHSGVSGSKIFSALDVVRILEQAPTAYDVDKVVKQLETGLEEILYDRCYSNDYDMGMKEVNALLDKVMKGGSYGR